MSQLILLLLPSLISICSFLHLRIDFFLKLVDIIILRRTTLNLEFTLSLPVSSLLRWKQLKKNIEAFWVLELLPRPVEAGGSWNAFTAELKSLLSLHYVRAYNSVVPSQTSLLMLLLNRLSYPTLCDPIDRSPPGSPILGILQARTLDWVAISFSNAWKWKVKVKSLSHVSLLATLCTAAYQAPLPMGFSRQEYWSGVPLPSPRSPWVSPKWITHRLSVWKAWKCKMLCSPFACYCNSDYYYYNNNYYFSTLLCGRPSDICFYMSQLILMTAFFC